MLIHYSPFKPLVNHSVWVEKYWLVCRHLYLRAAKLIRPWYLLRVTSMFERLRSGVFVGPVSFPMAGLLLFTEAAISLTSVASRR